MKNQINDRMPDNVKFVLEELNSNILRNYITNLQQEIKEANGSITWWTNRFKAVEEENRKIKDLCDKYEKEHNTTFKEWQKDIQANKRTIEYINKFWKEKSYYESVENCLKFATMNEFEKEDLIDILEGK